MEDVTKKALSNIRKILLPIFQPGEIKNIERGEESDSATITIQAPKVVTAENQRAMDQVNYALATILHEKAYNLGLGNISTAGTNSEIQDYGASTYIILVHDYSSGEDGPEIVTGISVGYKIDTSSPETGDMEFSIFSKGPDVVQLLADLLISEITTSRDLLRGRTSVQVDGKTR